MNTVIPLTTGVIMIRRRCRQKAISVSISPAIIVMPKTSRMPPTSAAATEGPMYVAENTGGAMKPDPTGPRGSA